MIDVFVQMPRRVARRGRAARDAAAGEAAVGGARASSTSTRPRAPGSRWWSCASTWARTKSARSSALNQKLAANVDRMPPGVCPPLVKAALHRRRAGDGADALGATATTTTSSARSPASCDDAIDEVPDVSEVTLIGGRPREVTVDIDPASAWPPRHSTR